MTCMILLSTDFDLYDQRDGHCCTLTMGSNGDAGTWVISGAGFVMDVLEERRVPHPSQPLPGHHTPEVWVPLDESSKEE